MGLVLSSTIRQLENFAGIMNFVIFPMFFASSALYPLWRIRESSVLLYQICAWNPFSHAVELIRSEKILGQRHHTEVDQRGAERRRAEPAPDLRRLPVLLLVFADHGRICCHGRYRCRLRMGGSIAGGHGSRRAVSRGCCFQPP